MNSVPENYGQMLRFFFSGSGPLLMVLTVMLCVVLKYFYYGWFWSDLFFLIFIVVVRGFFEWFLHACVLHAKPIPVLKVSLKTKMWEEHMEHHKRPDDFGIILTTYKGALLPPALIFFVSLFFMGSAGAALGFVLVYSLYTLFLEIVHLACHCNISHRSKIMSELVALHRYHHCQDVGGSFGVTSGMADKFFGTYFRSLK